MSVGRLVRLTLKITLISVLAGKMLESMSGHVSRCWQCFRISRFQRFTTVSGFMLQDGARIYTSLKSFAGLSACLDTPFVLPLELLLAARFGSQPAASPD